MPAYTTRSKQISDFIKGSITSSEIRYSAIKNGTNVTFTHTQLLQAFAEIYGASLRMFALQSDLLASGITVGEYTIVEENDYSFYKITADAASGQDVNIDDDRTATFQFQLKDDGCPPVLRLKDGVTAPSAETGCGILFIDEADDNLKIITESGTCVICDTSP